MHYSKQEEKSMKFFHHKLHSESRLCQIILAFLILICFIPLMIVFSASFTNEEYIQEFGYSILPHRATLDTYIFLIQNKGKMLLRAYGVTFLVVILGTIYALTMDTCFAYAVTQKKSVFRFSRILSFMAWFTTIFGGGVLPWYILCTRYYGLKNNIFALFIPCGLSVYNMFILRGNFREIPAEIIESARLDGASHGQIFVKIVIPMARGGIVTVALFRILGLWNDFGTPQYLITNSKLYTMQKILYGMLSNMTELMKNSEMQSILQYIEMPTYTAKMAIVVLTILPVILMYPFALKYFVKGINMGGVKG